MLLDIHVLRYYSGDVYVNIFIDIHFRHIHISEIVLQLACACFVFRCSGFDVQIAHGYPIVKCALYFLLCGLCCFFNVKVHLYFHFENDPRKNTSLLCEVHTYFEFSKVVSINAKSSPSLHPEMPHQTANNLCNLCIYTSYAHLPSY